jgi:hypothetical protein
MSMIQGINLFILRKLLAKKEIGQEEEGKMRWGEEERVPNESGCVRADARRRRD